MGVILPITGAVQTMVVKRLTKIDIHPSQMARDTPSNEGRGTSNLYNAIDANSNIPLTKFSLVLIGKFAFSNCVYLMKKYFIAYFRMKGRQSITFWGTLKCCIRLVPPHRGTCTKNSISERGTSFSGVDLISHGCGF